MHIEDQFDNDIFEGCSVAVLTEKTRQSFQIDLCYAFLVDFDWNLFVSQYQCQFSRESILKWPFCRAKWSPLLSWLQYKNVRPDYLNNIWKVMNWKYAGEVYENVLAWIVLMDNTHLRGFVFGCLTMWNKDGLVYLLDQVYISLR
jgi:hypothetical protein